MSKDESRSSRQRRRSITKRQRETTWGAELLLICQTVTEDGKLLEEEVHDLREWLEANENVDLPAKDVLLATVREILSDGRVTPTERSELYRIIETVLPPDLRDLARLKRLTAEERDREERKHRRSVEDEAARAARQGRRPVSILDFMVAGISYEGRAAVIARYADTGDRIYLVRDQANAHSRHAIEVRLGNGMQIGYVPEEIACDAAPLLDAGAKQNAHIKKILNARRGPIPVVIAELYRENADVPGAVTEAELPAKVSPPASLVAAATRDADEDRTELPASQERSGCMPLIVATSGLLATLWGVLAA